MQSYAFKILPLQTLNCTYDTFFLTILIVKLVVRGGNVSNKKDESFQVRNSTSKQKRSLTKCL